MDASWKMRCEKKLWFLTNIGGMMSKAQIFFGFIGVLSHPRQDSRAREICLLTCALVCVSVPMLMSMRFWVGSLAQHSHTRTHTHTRSIIFRPVWPDSQSTSIIHFIGAYLLYLSLCCFRCSVCMLFSSARHRRFIRLLCVFLMYIPFWSSHSFSESQIFHFIHSSLCMCVCACFCVYEFCE